MAPPKKPKIKAKEPKITTQKQSKDVKFQYLMAKKPGGQLHGTGGS
jgi:hypothetical protein